jgi:hypothetical protein
MDPLVLPFICIPIIDSSVVGLDSLNRTLDPAFQVNPAPATDPEFNDKNRKKVQQKFLSFFF